MIARSAPQSQSSSQVRDDFDAGATVDDLMMKIERKILGIPFANTIVEYVYWDAGGSKYYGSTILMGAVALKDIEKYFIDHEFFIPEHVGLRSLVPDVKTEDDHMLHKILSLEPTFDAADSVTPADILIGLMKWNKENNGLWP
jgi:hypothetical protein